MDVRHGRAEAGDSPHEPVDPAGAEAPARPRTPPHVSTTNGASTSSSDVTLASSREMGIWDGFGVENGVYHPREIDRPATTNHLITIPLGIPFYGWRRIGERLDDGLRYPGSASIFPAGRPSYIRWDRAAAVLGIAVSTELLEEVARPLLRVPDRVEIVPVFTTVDPQIEHIGMALLADLERGAPGGRLFGDTLVTALAVHLLRHYTAFPVRISDRLDKMPRVEVRRAIEYIHDNLDRDLSLREIAAYPASALTT